MEIETISAQIRALALQHGVVYKATHMDAWANHVTRLTGDDVELDAIELLLIEMQRRSIITRPEALALQHSYLREACCKGPSV